MAAPDDVTYGNYSQYKFFDGVFKIFYNIGRIRMAL